ncbi:hypothetical protein BD408DRAFT_479591 [Parasitella parasitica]|nr:hypothetical protein BD408DRAFT_479591 [Parasitella parasitica]
MKFFGIASAIVGAFVAIATAAPAATGEATKFYITAPLQQNTFNAGGVLTTQWKNGEPGPFKIELLQGTDPASMQDANVAFKNTDGSTGSYKWEIPKDFAAGTYALHFVFKDGESYSPQFKITSGKADSPKADTKTGATDSKTGANDSKTGSTDTKTGSTDTKTGSTAANPQAPATGASTKPDAAKQPAQPGAKTDNETGKA